MDKKTVLHFLRGFLTLLLALLMLLVPLYMGCIRLFEKRQMEQTGETLQNGMTPDPETGEYPEVEASPTPDPNATPTPQLANEPGSTPIPEGGPTPTPEPKTAKNNQTTPEPDTAPTPTPVPTDADGNPLVTDDTGGLGCVPGVSSGAYGSPGRLPVMRGESVVAFIARRITGATPRPDRPRA